MKVRNMNQNKQKKQNRPERLNKPDRPDRSGPDPCGFFSVIPCLTRNPENIKMPIYSVKGPEKRSFSPRAGRNAVLEFLNVYLLDRRLV